MHQLPLILLIMHCLIYIQIINTAAVGKLEIYTGFWWGKLSKIVEYEL